MADLQNEARFYTERRLAHKQIGANCGAAIAGARAGGHDGAGEMRHDTD